MVMWNFFPELSRVESHSTKARLMVSGPEPMSATWMLSGQFLSEPKLRSRIMTVLIMLIGR